MKPLDLKSGKLCSALRVGAGTINNAKPGIALQVLETPGAAGPVAFVIMTRAEAWGLMNKIMTALDDLDEIILKERAS